MGKFWVLFYPQPFNNSPDHIEQNERCHLSTSKGKEANNLAQFSSPVLPSPQHPAPTHACLSQGTVWGSWTNAQHLIPLQAKGKMNWTEAVGKSPVSSHLEDTAGEIN